MIAIIAQAAALFWMLLTPVGAFGKAATAAPKPKISTDILSRFDPFGRQDAVSVNGGAAGAFMLYGTRTDYSGGGGSAIISVSDGPQTSFAVGDEIAPNVRLVAVAVDHVIIDQGGVRQTLNFTDLVPVQSPVAMPAPVVQPVPAPPAPSVGEAASKDVSSEEPKT